MATMLSNSSIPAPVPFTIASIVLETSISGSSSAPPVRLVEGLAHHGRYDLGRAGREIWLATDSVAMDLTGRLRLGESAGHLCRRNDVLRRDDNGLLVLFLEAP